MQRQLDLAGSVFKHPGHYVPVLQDCAGELAALRQLGEHEPAVLDRLMPMIQIVGGKTRKLSRDAIKGHVNRTYEAFGNERPFYLDFVREDPGRVIVTKSGALTVAALAYHYARRRQMAFVPVAWVWGTDAHLNEAANAAVDHERGMALRHRPSKVPIGIETPAALVEKAVIKSQLGYEQIDLLIDLEYLEPDARRTSRRLKRIVGKLQALGPWRRIVLMGGSMPAVLSVVPENSATPLLRQEWAMWLALPPEVRRAVDFGDYGVQNPRPSEIEAGGNSMRANIRYATQDSHLVARAKGAVREEGRHQYRELCQRLQVHPDFDGASEGDRTISECAAGRVAPGDQGMWRQAGSARHLTVVSRQVLDRR